MYIDAMGWNICSLPPCEHELRSEFGEWLYLDKLVKIVLEMVFDKVRTMTWELLVRGVLHTVEEIAALYGVLVAPKFVYDLFVVGKRLEDNLNYIDQNCKCLKILSNYCHCKALQYFL
jgi:hypothetical protein